MKKILSTFLLAIIVLVVASAFAEEWVCPTCGTAVTGNFCNNCGEAKPSEDWVCPNCNNTVTGKFCNNCGTARPSDAAQSVNETVTTAPVQTNDDPEEFKTIATYALSPITNATVSNYIDMGENTFTIIMSNGDSYMGLISDTDGTYGIEIMNYGSSDYNSIESPYDCQSVEFKRVLNYLLRKEGNTVTAIIPMYGDIYSVQDSAGNTYMLTILCSPSMVTIALLRS